MWATANNEEKKELQQNQPLNLESLATNRESNQASDVRKEHYAQYYKCTKKLHFASRNWRKEN